MAATKKTSSKTTSGAAKGPVDKVLKAKWEKASDQYRAARDTETSGWDERYEALGDIVEAAPPLYLAGGYATMGGFLKAEVPGETERSVRRAIRVARHFDPADEAAHGVAKLEALLDYLAANGAKATVPAKIDLEKQRVRVADGKSYKMARFAQLTLAELRRAARAKVGGAAAGSAKVPAEVKKWKAVLAGAKLAQVGVSLQGGLLTFSGIEPEMVKKVGAALAKG